MTQELKASTLKTLKQKKIDVLDIEEGIIKCQQCGKSWTLPKSYVNTAEQEGSVKLEFIVDWQGRLPAGWWKCPEGCWKLL